MFTQCPLCNTIFQLSVSQLRAANGDVRCGQCLSVFNALDHLSEDVPPAQETETTENLAHDANEYHTGFEEIPDSMTNTDEPAIGTARTGQTDTRFDNTRDVFSDIISEVKGHDIPAEEIERFEEFLATNTLPTEDSLTINHSLPVEKLPPTDDLLTTGDSLFTKEPLLADNSLLADGSLPDDAIINTDFIETRLSDKTPTPAGETHFGDIDTVTAVLETDISFDDDEFAEFDAYLDKPEDAFTGDTARRINKTDANNDKIVIETIDPEPTTSSFHADTLDSEAKQQPDADNNAVPEENPQEETAHATEEPSSPVNETQTVNIPDLIYDDLHAARAEQLKPSNTPWIIGSLLLMFTLVVQVVYHSRDELAKDTSLRPWLIQVCEILNCTLSLPYDIKQIEIIGRDVRSHPSADKALIASTTLINNASFVQPFPLLTMVFSDINGTKIAQRRFTPREYLSNTVDLTTGMVPDMPIRIDLELVDPGKAAVNYEFYAEIDPRQTRPLT